MIALIAAWGFVLEGRLPWRARASGSPSAT
jgi:hypothetical protein